MLPPECQIKIWTAHDALLTLLLDVSVQNVSMKDFVPHD